MKFAENKIRLRIWRRMDILVYLIRLIDWLAKTGRSVSSPESRQIDCDATKTTFQHVSSGCRSLREPENVDGFPNSIGWPSHLSSIRKRHSAEHAGFERMGFERKGFERKNLEFMGFRPGSCWFGSIGLQLPWIARYFSPFLNGPGSPRLVPVALR